MTGESNWAVIGAVCVLAGVAFVVTGMNAGRSDDT
jgi:hypothetical protein